MLLPILWGTCGDQRVRISRHQCTRHPEVPSPTTAGLAWALQSSLWNQLNLVIAKFSWKQFGMCICKIGNVFSFNRRRGHIYTSVMPSQDDDCLLLHRVGSCAMEPCAVLCWGAICMLPQPLAFTDIAGHAIPRYL